MKENELYRALDASVTGCQPSDYWKNRMVRQIVKGEEMKKRTKLSIGAVILAALLLISTVGLAVGLLVHEYYAKVAEMERDGALDRWQLEDKVTFINTMKSCNFELAEDLYAQAVDESLPAEQREAAADQIINDTYGELLQVNLDYYQTDESDTLGMAPDVQTVFDERYFAEHPDWEETEEGMQAYFDALGHYMRDEIAMENYLDRYTGMEVDRPAVDEAYAAGILKEQMTGLLEWDAETVKAMTPQVGWDESFRMWTVSGEVSEESMEKAADPRKDMNPVRTGDNIEKTDTGYRYTILVDEQGRSWNTNLDKEAFRQRYLDEPVPLMKISLKQAKDLAEAAVKEQYHPDDAEWKEVFADAEDIGIGEADGRLYRIDFHRHYFYYRDADLLYGVTVNMATGKVEGMVSYRAEDRTAVWQLLEYAAKTEKLEGWYILWSPESRKGLAEMIRACGLLPEQAAQLSEADTDALVTELFGAEGRPALVNVKVMLHTLLGPEDTWSLETRMLAGRLIRYYDITSENLLPEQKAEGSEIDADEAVRIIRAAVCDAWEMPGDALDSWSAVARLVQDREPEDDEPGFWKTTGLHYRVFLTRPDAEVGQDTFGGLDNLNYRVALDGTILTTETKTGWYSPKEDKERWQK